MKEPCHSNYKKQCLTYHKKKYPRQNSNVQFCFSELLLHKSLFVIIDLVKIFKVRYILSRDRGSFNFCSDWVIVTFWCGKNERARW